MPTVRISDDTWERLKKYARPLEDSVDDVVRRALNALDKAKKPLPDEVLQKLGIKKPAPIKRRV